MASMILRSRFLATPASKMLWTSLTPTKMAAKHSALLLQVVQQRPLHTSYKVFFEAEKQPEQTEADGLCTEEHDRTIYQGILATQIKLVKSFSLLTSMIGISCQPVLMQQNNAHLAIMAGAGIFLSFFTFATPILIHWISKKYVTELNYNKLDDTYTAVTYSLLLRRKEVIYFSTENKFLTALLKKLKCSKRKLRSLDRL
jgi:hypothetical protein